MFEQLIAEAASRFNVSTASVSALGRGLLSLMLNERTGGAEGFIEQFRRAGLGDVITSWFGGREGRPIATGQVESALGAAGLDTLASSSGLARTTVVSVAAFLLPRLVRRLTPNGVLPSSSALLSHVSRYIEVPAAASRPTPPAEHRIERTAGIPAWLPWAAVAVLALAALLWMRGAGRAADPQLTIANRDGRVTYSGVVRDDTTRFTIVSALEKTFGKGSVTGDLQVDRRVTRAAWLPRLDELVAAVRTPGVDLSLTGNTLNVGGWVSAADHQALIGKLQGAFGSGMTVGSLADPAVAAVRAANDKALSALRAIGTSGVNPNAVVQAMNLAVINFQTGSAQIAQDSLDVVRTSAEAIKRMPDRAKVEIRGHTDNTGDPAGNLRLSEARADAVKTALVSAGVPAERLITRGYGDTQPRASNTTEYGRFQNRRIEYGVIQ